MQPSQDPQMASGIFGRLFPNMTADRQDKLAMALSGLSHNPNQAVMSMAQQRMDNRRADQREAAAQQQQAQQRNRTAEWLASQPGGQQYAEAIAAGALPAGQALQMYQASRKSDAVKGVEINGQLVNPQTGEVIGDYRDQAPAEPQIDTKGESDLRKEYTGRSDVKDFRKQADAFGRIRASAENPDAAGDLALIFNYMKLLDPGSVVREGEFATAQNAAGIDDRTRNIWNRLQNGERLTPEQRDEFVRRAGTIYEAARRQNESTETQYRDIARDYGYDPSRSVPDVSYQSELAPQSAPRPGQRPEAPQRRQQPIPTPSRQALDDAINKLTPHDRELLQSIPGGQAKLRFLIDRGVIDG